MGIFNMFKKKEPAMVESSISFVTNEKGEKYLHIKQFTRFLNDYKKEISDDDQKLLLDQLISELNKA